MSRIRAAASFAANDLEPAVRPCALEEPLGEGKARATGTSADGNDVELGHGEWAHKPVSFVSYGGSAGGTRAVQVVKPMLAALKMTALMESVMVPLFMHHIDAEGRFNATEFHEPAAKAALDALVTWTEVLKPLRG